MDQNQRLNCLSLTKSQFASQETLFEYHAKIEAMVEMMLAKDLLDYPREKLHDYLWTISDLMGKARKLNSELLDMVAKLMSLLKISEV
jgi:hypothetical protein